MQDSANHTGRSGDIPAEPQSRGIARRLLSPAAMAILAFAVACTLAMTHYADRGGIGLSWQTSYGPAVFLACTGTFGMPRSDASASRAEWSSALDDFLNERDEAFDCNALPRNLDVGWFAKRAGSSAYDVAVEFSQLGHLLLTGLWWKAVGVSWWGVAYQGEL